MPISVLCRGQAARDEHVDMVVQAVFVDLRAVDAQFSPYRSDSAVGRIRSGQLTIVESPPEVQEVAARAAHWRSLTGGRFDARRPDGTWDPSGLVKGWAVERVAARLATLESVDWCINAGGDVLLRCAGGRSLVVGIADPLSPSRIVTSLALTAGAVATSGTAARGRHLYDPRTGRDVAGHLASVSVTGPSLEQADVLATAAFVAGQQWTEVLARFPAYAGLAVDRSGRIEAGPGWPG